MDRQRAYCEHCKRTFPSVWPSMLPRGGVFSISESNMEQCPWCGNMAVSENMIGGRSAGFPKAAEVFEAIQRMGREELWGAQGIARAAQEGLLTPKEAKQRAADISPFVGVAFDWALALGALGVLLSAISICIAIYDLADGDEYEAASLAEQQRAVAVAEQARDATRANTAEIMGLRADLARLAAQQEEKEAAPQATPSRQVMRRVALKAKKAAQRVNN